MSLQSTPPRSWYDAWIDTATGADGFWRRARAADHFRTASQSPLLAGAISTLLDEPDQAAVDTVVEIGAGDSRLLDELRLRHPDRRFIAIDIAPDHDHHPRPRSAVERCTGLWDIRIDRWQGAAAELLASLPGPTMIIAAEWLDDLPCPIATSSTATGCRELLVTADGTESPGSPVTGDHAEWLEQWWPQLAGRAESGLTRDRAWESLIIALRRVGGSALMIDYGHLRNDRPAAGTLTGYAAGRQVPPRPDGSVNLTAHVAVDAVAAAGERAGARTTFRIDQRTAVDRYLPTVPGTEDDPLSVLQHRGERRFLSRTLGDHHWLLQQVAPSHGVARRSVR